MKTSSFLTALRTNAGLPLVFRAGRETVSPGYHLTEVKRVAYETMDCGAMTHRWAETQFEIWNPPSGRATDGRSYMEAGKFLRIIDRVETKLPLEDEANARIFASFSGQPAALYEIDGTSVREGKIWVELSPDRTRCKAAERAAAAGGCCGSRSTDHEGKEAGACGCNGREAAQTAAACCA